MDCKAIKISGFKVNTKIIEIYVLAVDTQTLKLETQYYLSSINNNKKKCSGINLKNI